MHEKPKEQEVGRKNRKKRDRKGTRMCAKEAEAAKTITKDANLLLVLDW